MSPLKIRLVPRPGKSDPYYERYKEFGDLATRKFKILKPTDDGDDAILVVLPTWLEPFSKLTDILGDLKVGDYFSHSFVVEYVNDTSADLNDFRLGKSSYLPYDANGILRGQKRWSDILPIDNHERAIVDCEMDDTLARATSDAEMPLEQDKIALFKSVGSATGKNNPKDPNQAEANGRLWARRPGISENRRTFEPVPVCPSAQTTDLARKRVLDLDFNEVTDAQTLPTRNVTSPSKRTMDANGILRTINQNDTDRFDVASNNDYIPAPTIWIARNGKHAYTASEDMAILQFLDEYNRHKNVLGYKSYKKMSQLQYFQLRGRTEQGLLSHFRKVIMPNIAGTLAEKPEMLRRFEEGLEWAKGSPHLPSEPFEKEPPWNWEPRGN